jgi:predicted DNA-binding transcriptional regulator YafY
MVRDDIVIAHTPLLRQLDILSYLAQRTGAFAEDLAEVTGASVPTIKRDIAELRHLGALIISDRNNGYRLMNWERIRTTVRRWRELERDREHRIARGL